MYVCLFLAVLSIKTTSKQPLVFHNILFVSIPELLCFLKKLRGTVQRKCEAKGV